MVTPRILMYSRWRGGVGRGAESARDVGGEGSIFEACDRRGGGVDAEGRYG
jgi:hypothetical protein